MGEKKKLYIFGEVLFDCFPTGEEILGGAPFNVAWHLQALGDQPCLISRVGKDSYGKRILQAMQDWGMDISLVQTDDQLPTGRVQVTIKDGEPEYDIVANSAYDFIRDTALVKDGGGTVLYHGTLGLRNKTSRLAYETIVRNPHLKIFLDVNLRSPWWNKDEIRTWLERASWVKMNLAELQQLSESTGDIEQQMAQLQNTHGLEQLIITRGEQGTLLRDTDNKIHSLTPERAKQMVDSVGAGDAFSAVYLHGLLAGWPIARTLYCAQAFASKVIGLRGATTTDLHFYQDFIRNVLQ